MTFTAGGFSSEIRNLTGRNLSITYALVLRCCVSSAVVIEDPPFASAMKSSTWSDRCASRAPFFHIYLKKASTASSLTEAAFLPLAPRELKPALIFSNVARTKRKVPLPNDAAVSYLPPEVNPFSLNLSLALSNCLLAISKGRPPAAERTEIFFKAPLSVILMGKSGRGAGSILTSPAPPTQDRNPILRLKG